MKIKEKEFLGREEYLRRLKSFYEQKGSSFTSVQGRRRVGKSEILKEFQRRNKSSCFIFIGIEDDTILKSQKKIINQWADYSKEKTLSELDERYLYWERILDEMFSWASKEEKPTVFVFDEIQWISKKGSGFAGSLKNSYEKHKSSNKIKIIICGSSIRFFKNNRDHSEKALMGLTTFGKIIVKPFSVKEVKNLYFPRWTNEEVCLTHMMLGGIPYYLDKLKSFDEGQPFRQVINRAIFCSDTIFLDRIDELIDVDFNKQGVITAKKILKEIRYEGSTEASIVKKTKLNKSIVNRFLFALETYEIISKKNKLRDHKGNDNGSVYVINDFFINFYYQVLENHSNKIKSNENNELIFPSIISSKNHYEIKDFSGTAFERLIQYVLIERMHKNCPKLFQKINLITYEYEVGTYWKTGKDGTQIDIIVEDDEDKCTRIIECKWVSGSNLSPKEIINQIEGKKFDLKDDHTRMNVLAISQQPSPTAMKIYQENNVKVITLDDLF